jgi:hypothetical protein
LAFALFLEPFCFLETLFWSTLSLWREFFKYFGFSIFSPVESTAKSLIPTSIPQSFILKTIVLGKHEIWDKKS